MDDRVDAALRAGFPDREVVGVASAGPSWNAANRTVRVEFADGEPVYLKVAADGDGRRVARERAVVEYVAAATAVPVPTVVASDAGGDVPYLATAPMTGEPLVARWGEADGAGRRRLARAVGRSLARVHGRRFDAHGRVTGGRSEGLAIDTAPWTDVLVDRVERMRRLSPDDCMDHHFDAVAHAVEENRDLLDGAPAALVHGDPAQPNCVYDDGVGFLDWELAHVGDPARDLYRTRDQQFGSLRGEDPADLVVALHDGYRAQAGELPTGLEIRRPVYRAVRLLGVSGYVERTASSYDEPTEELADWLEAEMDRRLAAL